MLKQLDQEGVITTRPTRVQRKSHDYPGHVPIKFPRGLHHGI